MPQAECRRRSRWRPGALDLLRDLHQQQGGPPGDNPGAANLLTGEVFLGWGPKTSFLSARSVGRNADLLTNFLFSVSFPVIESAYAM